MPETPKWKDQHHSSIINLKSKVMEVRGLNRKRQKSCREKESLEHKAERQKRDRESKKQKRENKTTKQKTAEKIYKKEWYQANLKVSF
jgi:hypothetical protein